MVQENSASESEEVQKMEPKLKLKGIKEGDYKLIGFSTDTTGKRLIDEICQIATYTPESQFSQYIMPYSNIHPVYRERHNVKVITKGKHRMLIAGHSNEFIPTKSEISALTDFLQWLETNKGDAKDGIILIYHEYPKTVPGMLLEALHRNRLYDRFVAVVKGFANSFSLSQAKCENTTKWFSLPIMTKVLLNLDEDLSSAATRAKICYNIVLHLGQSERNELDVKGSGDGKVTNSILINMICPHSNPIDVEEEDIKDLKIYLERQKTLTPIFSAHLKASTTERHFATRLRRLLAENNISFETLKGEFEKNAKDGLEELLKNGVPGAAEEDMKDLLEILDCYLDPDKTAIEPKKKFFQNDNRRFRTTSINNKQQRRRSSTKRYKNRNANSESGVKSEINEIVADGNTTIDNLSENIANMNLLDNNAQPVA